MPILVDTNVPVRAVRRNHPLMRTARGAVRSLVRDGQELCVAYQNIAEFWNVCTRPAEANGLGISIAATDRLALRIFTLLPDSPESFRQWRRLIVTHEVKGAKVDDARLAAIMQTYGLRELLTFNPADFRRYEHLKTLDPSSLLS